MVYSRQTPKGQQMKKLSIIAEKLNICQVSGWNEKWGSEIRQEFAVKPRLVAPVPPVSLHPQAEWCPWPLYLQFCIWAQSHIWARVIHCAFLALTTGLLWDPPLISAAIQSDLTAAEQHLHQTQPAAAAGGEGGLQTSQSSRTLA